MVNCRPGGRYEIVLDVLDHAKKYAQGTGRDLLTKTGIMLGLGEDRGELMSVLADLRSVDCDILTLGQYLRPSPDHLPVVRYLPPEEFADLNPTACFGLPACGIGTPGAQFVSCLGTCDLIRVERAASPATLAEMRRAAASTPRPFLSVG